MKHVFPQRNRNAFVVATSGASRPTSLVLAWPLRRFPFCLGCSAPALAQAQRVGPPAATRRTRATDAILATPNAATPTPQSNLYATSPGLEEQSPAPRFGANLLLPFG